AGQRGRVALAIPFAGDLALLSGVGILYSRFGTLTLDNLFSALTTTPGVGLKSLTAAAILMFVAAAVRASIWPFTAWQTATVDARAASVAAVAGVWPVLAGALLLKMLPLMGSAGVQALLIAGYTLGVAAVVGPLLGLVGVELRRSILLASSGAVALTLYGLLYRSSASIAFSRSLPPPAVVQGCCWPERRPPARCGPSTCAPQGEGGGTCRPLPRGSWRLRSCCHWTALEPSCCARAGRPASPLRSRWLWWHSRLFVHISRWPTVLSGDGARSSRSASANCPPRSLSRRTCAWAQQL